MADDYATMRDLRPPFSGFEMAFARYNISCATNQMSEAGLVEPPVRVAVHRPALILRANPSWNRPLNRPAVEQQAMTLRAVLEKEQPLSEADLEVLRHNTAAASNLSGKSDYFVFRMEIELIYAILKLDQSSSRFARVALWLTGTGVMLAVLQVVEAMMSLRHCTEKPHYVSASSRH